MAEKDLFKTDIPTGAEAPSNAERRVLESRRMALAPVPTPASLPGAVPPQNLEAEESGLGAMMIASGAIAAVSEILDAGDFYRESHAKIYRAALGLYGRGEPVDAITLVDELEERGDLDDVGGGGGEIWMAAAGAGASTSWPRSSPPPRTRATTRASSARWRRCAA